MLPMKVKGQHLGWMNTLISIGCIITDQLYSPSWPYETTKNYKNPKKGSIKVKSKYEY